ncbi:hypothetical protein ED733_002145 [Metarhizium rileyi]|uniref:Phosphonopyruvate decarboxylase n=1 Tax=Metarhizium rileyi (strain RCEF 4871) TaxID=1649241 RepID=A0A5C6GIW2_METRR|nr:hypothetical protein ED733_002145 [Metarhizium rileyi]
MPFDPSQFYHDVLQANGIKVAFGVPDSVLSGLSNFLFATGSMDRHIITANEGGAVALASGYHLATGRVALVYMQNSGLANALNPLQSLAAKEVFGIPMLLVIGWRGKPTIQDEPQHALVGPRLMDMLASHDLPAEELPDTISEARDMVACLVEQARRTSSPVSLIVPPRRFSDYKQESWPSLPAPVLFRRSNLQVWTSAAQELPLSREAAIRCVLREVRKTDITVSSLGGASRELYMIRQEKDGSIGADFMSIGAMGHAFALAHGISIGCPSRRVFCLDGDGSFLMHVGNNAVLAGTSQHHVIHILLYNGVYESTGSQPLMLSKANFYALAEGLPYNEKYAVDSAEMLAKACSSAQANTLIIVSVNSFVSKSLPRPSGSPRLWKESFMASLR